MRRYAPLVAIGLVVTACSDDPFDNPTPVPVTTTHVIRDVDYVKNTCFFVDNPTSFIGAQETGFEVYKTVLPSDLIADPNILRFPGWAIADPTGYGASIQGAAVLIENGGRSTIPGRQEDFQRLLEGVDYQLMVSAGPLFTVVGIELTKPIPDAEVRSLAIRYANGAGAIGGSYATYGITDPATGQPVLPRSSADTLMLEMIKAPDPRPDGPFGMVWPLAMRNIYDLGFTDIDASTFRLVIEDTLSPRADQTVPEGSTVPYLRIFGLDETNAAGTGPPDGKIDIGYVDLQRGLITMPSVRGFVPDPALVNQWTDGLFAFTGVYQAQYDQSANIYAQRLLPGSVAEANAHQYVFKASVTTQPTP